MKPASRVRLRCGVLSILMLAACPLALSQNQSRVIEWPNQSTFNSKTPSPNTHYVDRIEEVEIESISVEGQTVSFGTPFTSSDGWLNNISFIVKNISTRKIKQVQITLIMPELGRMHRIQIPYLCRECGRKTNPISLEPGASANLTLADGIYEWAKGIINENLALSKITRAQVLVTYVTFDEGTMIASDCMRTSDSRNRCSFGSQ